MNLLKEGFKSPCPGTPVTVEGLGGKLTECFPVTFQILNYNREPIKIMGYFPSFVENITGMDNIPIIFKEVMPLKKLLQHRSKLAL